MTGRFEVHTPYDLRLLEWQLAKPEPARISPFCDPPASTRDLIDEFNTRCEADWLRLRPEFNALDLSYHTGCIERGCTLTIATNPWLIPTLRVYHDGIDEPLEIEQQASLSAEWWLDHIKAVTKHWTDAIHDHRLLENEQRNHDVVLA